MMNIKSYMFFFFICIYSNFLCSMGWSTHYGWLTLEMKLKGTRNSATVITLKGESALVTKITYKSVGYAEDLVQALFGLKTAPGAIKPGDIFTYNSSTNYNGMIEGITNQEKKTFVRNAFAEFQNYVNKTIEAVCANGSTYNTQVDTKINNPYTTAAKDLYNQAALLGKKLGVTFPDLDATWTRTFKRSIPYLLTFGGIGLAYYFRTHLPSIGDIGCSLERTGKWLQPQKPASTPTTIPNTPIATQITEPIMPTKTP